jgi:hypothetical protein
MRHRHPDPTSQSSCDWKLRALESGAFVISMKYNNKEKVRKESNTQVFQYVGSILYRELYDIMAHTV